MSDETRLRFQFQVGVDEASGKPCIDFTRAVTVVLMAPSKAIDLAQGLIDAALLSAPDPNEKPIDPADYAYIDSKDNVVLHLPSPTQRLLIGAANAVELAGRFVALARAINGERIPLAIATRQ
jgi:hypothetical protein